MTARIAILNGFDRCGSSAISRSLALHPEIELLFQPFNSSGVRVKMNQVWSNEVASDDDFHFFSELSNGRLWREYIASDWFEKYSTTRDIVSGSVNVIKTNLNHMTIAWVRQNFPNIESWGIWRDPYDVLASLLRNDFYHKWFQGAECELATTVNGNRALFPDEFSYLYSRVSQRAARAMAYIISVRTYFLFSHVDSNRLLIYEKFKQNMDSELSKFADAYCLKEYRWQCGNHNDLNVTGADWIPEKSHQYQIPQEDRPYVAEAFEPVFKLMKRRFEVTVQMSEVQQGAL